MKFMMFVCSDAAPDTDPTEPHDIHKWVADNDARGRRLTGNVLGPAGAATTVRVRTGGLLVSEGPFAETAEVIVGFDLLDRADLGEAICTGIAEGSAALERVRHDGPYAWQAGSPPATPSPSRSTTPPGRRSHAPTTRWPTPGPRR
ncbi:YciI family protein [Micromonospora sp. DT4]|uniref:YciI family protein n=1 Tax=Micromonospora sp. DT4 TaxID=3393438 RepID=UPI003CF1C48D